MAKSIKDLKEQKIEKSFYKPFNYDKQNYPLNRLKLFVKKFGHNIRRIAESIYKL